MTAVELFRHPRGFPDDVTQLFKHAERAGIELGPAWFGNLVDSVFADDPGVRFYVLRRDGRPVAALPLLVAQQAGGKQIRSLTNYYSALYAPALDDAASTEDVLELLRAVFEREGPIASLRLDPMDPDSLAYRRLLEGLARAGFKSFQYFNFGNWYMSVEGDWPAYLASREGVLRSTIKRMGKKFAVAGGALTIVREGESLERAIADYQQVYARSWKVPEPYPRFVPELIRVCARHGWLRLGIARLGDHPVAAQIWIVAHGKASIYKLAYDEAFKQYAPGTLLTCLLMEQALESGEVREVDYLIGDDPYKQSWMSARRERWGVLAYNPRNLRGLAGWLRDWAGRIAKRLLARVRPEST